MRNGNNGGDSGDPYPGATSNTVFGPGSTPSSELNDNSNSGLQVDNIQVNAILPGWLYTDLTRSAIQQLPELHDRVLQRTPQGRWGEPEDLAGTAVFLASRASD